jgi:hypothetical protein
MLCRSVHSRERALQREVAATAAADCAVDTHREVVGLAESGIAGWDEVKAKKLLSKNAFGLLPQGVPTQFAPLVVESKERPVRSPIGVTLSQ